jgi:hypothetical protein
MSTTIALYFCAATIQILHSSQCQGQDFFILFHRLLIIYQTIATSLSIYIVVDCLYCCRLLKIETDRISRYSICPKIITFFICEFLPAFVLHLHSKQNSVLYDLVGCVIKNLQKILQLLLDVMTFAILILAYLINVYIVLVKNIKYYMAWLK